MKFSTDTVDYCFTSILLQLWQMDQQQLEHSSVYPLSFPFLFFLRSTLPNQYTGFSKPIYKIYSANTEIFSIQMLHIIEDLFLSIGQCY